MYMYSDESHGLDEARFPTSWSWAPESFPMTSASDWTSGAPLMKLNTRQAMTENVSKNVGPIFVNAIKRKVKTYQKFDYKEMLLC